MGTVQSNYELNAQEMSLLCQVLKDEYRSVKLGSVARVSFRILESAAYFLPFLLILAFGLAFLSDAFTNGCIPEGEIGDKAHKILDVLISRVDALIIPASGLLAVILIFNLPLFWKSYRQWRLSHRLTALELVDVEFRAPSRFPRIGKFRIAALLGPTAILMIFVYNILRHGLAVHGWWDSLVAFTLLIFLPVMLLLIDNLFRRLQVRLDYVKEVLALRKELNSFGTAESILPKDLATRLDGIERSRLLRLSAAASRRRLTDLFLRPAYAVRKSDKAADTLVQLKSDERLILETALEKLASQSAKAQKDKDSPSTLDVPGTSWRLLYEVEPKSRVIYIVSILRQGENQN